MSVVIYCDGSYKTYPSVKGTPTPSPIASWGVVALHDDAEHELFGATRGHALNGTHEFFAFYEAILYAYRANFQPNETSIFSDCQQVAEFVTDVQPGPYCSLHLSEVISKMKRFYSPDKQAIIIEYTRHARIQFVNGDDRGFYHHRADYLARYARRTTDDHPLLPIEKWGDWQRTPWMGEKWVPAFGDVCDVASKQDIDDNSQTQNP